MFLRDGFRRVTVLFAICCGGALPRTAGAYAFVLIEM
jgi:hypothetical protein